jgi:hypothetical protein
MNPFYVLVEIERIASCGILQSYSWFSKHVHE